MRLTETERDLRLFVCSPTVRRVLDLDWARSGFMRLADEVVAHGPFMPGYEADWYVQAAKDCVEKRNGIMRRIRVDGAPIVSDTEGD